MNHRMSDELHACLLQIAQSEALAAALQLGHSLPGATKHDYLPSTAEGAKAFKPHWWVMEAMATAYRAGLRDGADQTVFIAGKQHITLSAAEIESGLDRVRHAEGLIQQLPADHNGRNTWLMLYGQRNKDPNQQEML